ncbi:autotransporter outer membrane beta-barrel domain-containing protein [Selenomonas sputigena]|uniref:autotransporter outer membrane beta-barrel domain-containing protein n=1 Tax=Selenomonas sputigena TaxID=69823 RepID=UPI003F679B3C
MFTKQHKKRYLALAVALTLGGSLWGGAACTEAADAYTIDAGNPTPDAAHSVPDEGNGPGVAAGFTNAAAALTGNTLTVDGVTYAGLAYGGYNKGGGVTGNHLIIQNGGGISPYGFVGGKAYGGRAGSGGDARGNTVTINGGSAQYVYGGYAEGTGSADGNRVTLTSGTVHSVLGGSAKGTAGNANGNTVIITGGDVTSVYGGDAAGPNNNPNNESGNADGNTVDIGAINVNVVYGGSSEYGTTNNNTIHLRGTRVSGRVVGGSRPNSTGNTLAIHDFGTQVEDIFEQVQNLHFYLPEGTTGNSGNTMLTINSPSGQDIRGVHIGVGIAGQRSALQKGDVISLLKTSRGDLTTDAALVNDVSGMQGVSLRYKFDLQKRSTDELIATVTDAAVMEQTKSFVETRAAASALLNGGADLLSGMGMDAAETAAAAPTADTTNAAIESGSYELWAAQGASGERIETGSYVDAKGWNLAVGFAKRDAMDAGKLTYGPFVEYGRGSYDSYLDDGTHGDGSTSYIGGGFMVKWAGADQSYVEASLHAGRIKSDYSGNISGTSTSYDASNSYLAGHIGIGKKFDLGTDAALEGYAKYFWSRQDGTSATLATGEQYDFGSVTSSRVRLGVRYTKKPAPESEFYAGLAWEYEFDGDATATYQGYATPSPSLKGSSGMLEIGYRFAPKEGSVSYGVNLTGWQGKRKGITGGAHVSWAF